LVRPYGLQKKSSPCQMKKRPGDIIHLEVAQQNGVKNIPIKLETKYQKSFAITRVAKPNSLQAVILSDWLKSK